MAESTGRGSRFLKVFALAVAGVALGGLWAGGERSAAKDPPRKAQREAEVKSTLPTNNRFVAFEQVRVIDRLIAQQWKENTTKDAKGNEIPITPSRRCTD